MALDGCPLPIFDLTKSQLVFLWERLQQKEMRRRVAYCNDTVTSIGAVLSEEGSESFKRHTEHLATLANGGKPVAPPADTYTPIEALLG